jgi:hypothetical protein
LKRLLVAWKGFCNKAKTPVMVRPFFVTNHHWLLCKPYSHLHFAATQAKTSHFEELLCNVRKNGIAPSGTSYAGFQNFGF